MICSPARRHHAHGFTLIELMIAVVVVGIISAIAFPNYQKFVMKGRRVDARIALMDLAARQERYFASYNKYSLVGTELGYAGNFPMATGSGSTSYYTTTVTQATTGDYTLKATPTGNQATDACYAYVVNSLGVESNVKADGSVNTTAGCW